jgi:hypothetical protein
MPACADSQPGGDAVRVYAGGSSGNIAAAVVDLNNGRYRASYMPAAGGSLELSVLIDGMHVDGSPFVVAIAASAGASACSHGVSRLIRGGGRVQRLLRGPLCRLAL